MIGSTDNGCGGVHRKGPPPPRRSCGRPCKQSLRTCRASRWSQPGGSAVWKSWSSWRGSQLQIALVTIRADLSVQHGLADGAARFVVVQAVQAELARANQRTHFRKE